MLIEVKNDELLALLKKYYELQHNLRIKNIDFRQCGNKINLEITTISK